MLIWDELGMTLDDYARAFNKAMDEVFDGPVEGRTQTFNFIIDKPRACGVIEMNEEKW